MLRRFGFYLTKNIRNALWVALICGALPILGLPVGWIGLVIVALVTLYEGHKEGLGVLAIFGLPVFIIGLLGNFLPFMELVIYRGLVIWALALVLRQTASWVMVLRASVILGTLVIITVYLFFDDVSGWWLKQFHTFLGRSDVLASLWDSREAMEAYLISVSHFATGMAVTGFLVINLIVLVLARGWQALLFNPGGLSKELKVIRFNKIDSMLLIFCVIAAWFGLPLVTDLVPLFTLAFVIAGLSLVHVETGIKKEIKIPLRVFVYLLIVLFFSYMLLVLAFVALIDSWYDFRAKQGLYVK